MSQTPAVGFWTTAWSTWTISCTRRRGEVDRHSVRLTLRELGELIASKRMSLGGPEYQGLLARLVAIFASGAAPASELALATSAPSYAAVVAALSRACPTCDYEAALGQLLTYMGRLFLDRRSGWKAIYRAIASISDGVAAKRRLDDGEFYRIEEWIESGASNLFSIQRDLAHAIAALEDEAAELTAEMARIGPLPSGSLGWAPGWYPWQTGGRAWRSPSWAGGAMSCSPRPGTNVTSRS